MAMRGGAGFKRERGREHEDGKKVIEYGVEGAVRWMAGGKGKGKGDDLIVSKRGHLHD
jgi:hypothetical protein